MNPPASSPTAPPEPERATAVQGTRRRRKRGRGYYRSGFYALKTTLRTLGPRVIDRRTHLGRQLAAWKADLVRDLGGDVQGVRGLDHLRLWGDFNALLEKRGPCAVAAQR